MRIAGLVGIGLAVILGASATALADGTADGVPPAQETVCEDAGLVGAAYGLCVAYCEANDCELTPDAQSCQVLRSNYAKITGLLSFPCDEVMPQ